MELEEIKRRFDQQIKKFVKRLEINYVVCEAPRHHNGKSWTEKECDKYLKKNPRNKLEVNHIFMLNDYTKSEIRLETDEYNALNESLQSCREFLIREVVEFCKWGENQYELNKLFKSAFSLIQSTIVKMNYEVWWEEILKSNLDNSFILLIGNKKIYRSATFFDIRCYCDRLVTFEFSHREILLYRLKDYLIDIYSEYLLLPEINSLPKIKYTCKPTDICELLLAISKSKDIIDSEALKAVLMEMFDISQSLYNNGSHSIINRHKMKSVFVQKLSDVVNKLPSSKNKGLQKQQILSQDAKTKKGIETSK